MNSGMIGICARKIFSSCVAITCCFSGSSVTFHWSSSFVAWVSYVCSQLPVVEASSPDGMSALCDRLAKKKPYGEACDPFCQSRVGCFVAYAFGNHELKSGSSFTFESRPRSRRFFVMIWFDATQSDQPEITWMSSETALPFGSNSLLPLYVNPASVSTFLAAVGLYVGSSLERALIFASVTQLGKSPLRPIASVGGA